MGFGLLPVGEVDLVDDFAVGRCLKDEGFVVRVVKVILAICFVVLETQAVWDALGQPARSLLAKEGAVGAVSVPAHEHLGVFRDVRRLKSEVEVPRGVARDAVAVQNVLPARGGRRWHLEQVRLVLKHPVARAGANGGFCSGQRGRAQDPEAQAQHRDGEGARERAPQTTTRAHVCGRRYARPRLL